MQASRLAVQDLYAPDRNGEEVTTIITGTLAGTKSHDSHRSTFAIVPIMN